MKYVTTNVATIRPYKVNALRSSKRFKRLATRKKPAAERKETTHALIGFTRPLRTGSLGAGILTVGLSAFGFGRLRSAQTDRARDLWDD
jgi:hypothetical protein